MQKSTGLKFILAAFCLCGAVPVPQGWAQVGPVRLGSAPENRQGH